MKIPLSPVRCLYRAVDLYGEKTGVICGDSRYTYAQFGARCERLAAGLRAEGVGPGDRVAYLSFNTHKLLEGYYGAPLLRAITMPLNVRLAPAELISILNHAEPKILVFESDFAPLVAAFRKSCPSIGRYIAADEFSPGGDYSYEELISREPIERPDPLWFDEDEIAEIFYTSGSTGTPKGVALSHRTVYLHALNALASIFGGDSDIELHTIPLFHANGWGKAHTPFLLGAAQVMVRRFECAQVLRLIEQERATTMSLVPVMAGALLNSPDLGRFDTRSLREIHMGGAASSPELIRRMEQAFGCKVLVGYGLTETSPIVSTSRHKGTIQYATETERLFRTAMAGWPVMGTEIRVVDSEMLEVPRDGEAVGEVVVRSDNVMDGYYREPEATERAITDSWFHTGDMAVWDKENYIQIVDRKKDIIISGGENISSIEIEKAISAHPAVLECAVVAAPDPKWGEVPVAILVLKPGARLDDGELLTFLSTRIAKFKLPQRIEFADGPLPKTGTGKILKRELREAFWVGKERRVQGG